MSDAEQASLSGMHDTSLKRTNLVKDVDILRDTPVRLLGYANECAPNQTIGLAPSETTADPCVPHIRRKIGVVKRSVPSFLAGWSTRHGCSPEATWPSMLSAKPCKFPETRQAMHACLDTPPTSNALQTLHSDAERASAVRAVVVDTTPWQMGVRPLCCASIYVAHIHSAPRCLCP